MRSETKKRIDYALSELNHDRVHGGAMLPRAGALLVEAALLSNDRDADDKLVYCIAQIIQYLELQ